jgi:adenylosuccinate lyase
VRARRRLAASFGETQVLQFGGASGSLAALVLAAGALMLAATVVTALPQEHERALGGWQGEWPMLAALVETLGSAVEAMAEVPQACRSIPMRFRRTWMQPRPPSWPSARTSCSPRRCHDSFKHA